MDIYLDDEDTRYLRELLKSARRRAVARQTFHRRVQTKAGSGLQIITVMETDLEIQRIDKLLTQWPDSKPTNPVRKWKAKRGRRLPDAAHAESQPEVL